MAASTEQKLDYLLKKIGYTASKTGLAEDSSLSGTKKAPFAEAIPSPLVTPSTTIWNESALIPTTPPGSDTAQVRVYLAGTSGHRMTVDSTVSGSRAFIAYSTYNNTSTAILGDWIDPQFGDAYIIKVYKGDPNSGGTLLSAAGAGSNDTWFFDYSSGVLNFNGTVIPSGVTDTNIYIVGYRYIGVKGLSTAGITTSGTSTLKDLNVTGVSTFAGNINANGNIIGDNSTNISGINSVTATSLFANLTGNVSGIATYTSEWIVTSNGSSDYRFTGPGFDATENDPTIYLARGQQYKFTNHMGAHPFEIRTAINGSAYNDGVVNNGVSNGTLTWDVQMDAPNVLYYQCTAHAGMVGKIYIGNSGNSINVGSGVTITGGGIDVTGVITATSFSGTLQTAAQPNITSVGTLSSLNVTGDVSIGGTLTYEDVTNIDSVGLITARTGIKVLAGGINAVGVVTANSFDGSLATTNLTGTITNAQLAGSIANDKLANSTVSYGGVSLALGETDATPAFNLTDATNYPFTSLTGITTTIFGDATPKLGGDLNGNSKNIFGVGVLTATTFSGNISGVGATFTSITGTLITAAQPNITSLGTLTGLDVNGHSELDNLNVSGVSTFVDDIKINNINKSLQVGDITNDNYAQLSQVNVSSGTSIRGFDTTYDNASVLDNLQGSLNQHIILGDTGNTNGDTLFGVSISNSSGAFFKQLSLSGTGDLNVANNITGVGATFTNITGTLQTAAQTNITSVGTLGALTVSGNINANGNIVGDNATNISGINSVTATTYFGDGTKLIGVSTAGISTEGTTTLKNLEVTGVTTFTTTLNNNQVVSITNNGTVGANGLKISSGGNGSGSKLLELLSDNQSSETSRFEFLADGTFRLPNDNAKIRLGASNDLLIRYDGSDGSITQTGSGNLHIRGNGTDQIKLQAKSGEQSIICYSDAAVELYYDNTKRFETTNTGVSITGNNVVSGNVSAVDGTFSGNVSIGGTLTYEDVTNIDSVGIVTARTGIKVLAGGINAVGVVTGTNGLSGTILTAAQTNITSVGTLSALTVSGNINANGNIVGDSATNISGMNNISATSLTGALATAAQTNITSVGTLTGLTVSGDIDANSGLDVAGISTLGITSATNLEAQQLNVTGVSTFGGQTTVNALFQVSGNVTLGTDETTNIDPRGKFVRDLIPSGSTGTYGLGRADKGWNVFGANASISGITTVNNFGVTGVSTVGILTVYDTTLIEEQVRLRFADANRRIYADGTDLNMKASASANLILKACADGADTGKIIIANVGSGVTINPAGSVDVYHASSKKLETTSTGVVVTGIATATTFSGDLTGTVNTAAQPNITSLGTLSAVTVSGNINANGNIVGDSSTNITGIAGVTASTLTGTLQTAAQPNITSVGTLTSLDVSGNITGAGDLTLTDTDAGSAAGPELNLERLSGSPADADYLGQINFKGKQDGGGTVNYAKITGKILDASNGTEDGILEFMLKKAGSNNIAARFRSDSLQLLNGTSLTVAGTAEVDGNITANGNIVGDDSTNISGINSVTAVKYYGNGEHLTGITADGVGAIGGLTVKNQSGAVVGTAGSVSTLDFNGSNGVTITATSGAAGIATIAITGFSTSVGTFNASSGVATIDSFAYATEDYKVAEYTLHFANGSDIQAQKLLIMQDGSTAYSQEFAVMSSGSQLVSLDATISGANVLVRATPESGISGVTTFRWRRTVQE